MNRVLNLMVLVVIGSTLAASAQMEKSGAESNKLQALNVEYVRTVEASDVGWLDRHLAANFVCTNLDGSLVDRAGFLKQTALPIRISNLQAHDVMVRGMGDFALIHAATTYTRRDGQTGSVRDTDAWRRQQGQRFVVSAHITPVP